MEGNWRKLPRAAQAPANRNANRHFTGYMLSERGGECKLGKAISRLFFFPEAAMPAPLPTLGTRLRMPPVGMPDRLSREAGNVLTWPAVGVTVRRAGKGTHAEMLLSRLMQSERGYNTPREEHY